MLKTLGAQIREFKKDSLLTPVFMILEVFMETIIPLMMASIIDQGVEAGNIHHLRHGCLDGCRRLFLPLLRCHGRKIRCKSLRRFCT